MSALLVIIHVIVCIALILIVLLQTGKGADMGAAFGGGSNQTLFGSTGASTFLSKATTFAAIIFMVTSLGLAYMSGQGKSGSSIMDQVEAPAPQSVSEPEKAPEAAPETPVVPVTSEAVTTVPAVSSPAETVKTDAETAAPETTPPPSSEATTATEDDTVKAESSEAPVTTPSESAPAAMPEAGTDSEKVQ